MQQKGVSVSKSYHASAVSQRGESGKDCQFSINSEIERELVSHGSVRDSPWHYGLVEKYRSTITEATS
jgi:hypothetical protein